MIQTTTWRPDTCACSITYQWDSDLPGDQRVHTPVSSNPCDIHIAVGDHVAVFSAVSGENQGKNKAYDDICIAVPRLVPDDFKFSFDKQRNLIVDVKGLDPSETTLVQSTLSQKHPTVILKNDQIATG